MCVCLSVHVCVFVRSCLCVCVVFTRVASSQSTHRELLKFVMVPVDSLENPLSILKLEHVGEVFSLFDYNGRKTLASHLVQAIVDKVAYITTSEEVDDLFQLLAPLVQDQPDQPQDEVGVAESEDDDKMMMMMIIISCGLINFISS